MNLRLSLLMVIVVLVPMLSAVGQNTHDRPGFPQLVNAGRVSYEIKATVDTRRDVVRGAMEVDYRNLEQDTLRDVLMALPRSSDGESTVPHIDSILINGQPVEGMRAIRSHVVSIPLFTPLLPGGRIHLYVSFTATLDRFASREGAHPILSLVDWHPRISSRSGGRWIYADSGEGDRCLVEAADYAVAVSIDTGWMAAAFGTLINEKEVYGIIPRTGDTTIVDLPHDSIGDPFAPSAYKHPDGRVTYAWRSLQRPSFPVTLFKGGRFDRVVADSVVVDLFSLSGDGEDLWEESLQSVAKSVHILSRLLGGSPERQIALVAGISATPGDIDRSPLLPASPETGTVEWMAAQITSLARVWSMPVIANSGTHASLLQSGVTNYLAIELAHQLSPGNGYDLCARYADDQIGLDHVKYSAFGHGPFSFMNRLQRRQFGGESQERKFEQFYRIPAKLHMLRELVGDSPFWDRLASAVRLENGGYMNEHRFWARLSGGDGLVADFCDGTEISSIDFALMGVRQEDESDSITISGFCDSNLPFTVSATVAAIISSQDTVWQEVDIQGMLSSTIKGFTLHLNRMPRAIILDPQGLFPDSDRSNNVVSFWMPTHSSSSPHDLFPGYRRLRLP
ncbi:MAG: hypothetical protein WAU88_16275 [Candidatus Zixiibacteriota bacterium]